MKKILTLVSLMLAYLQGFAAFDYSNPANNNYVGEWGRLKLVGNQLCSEKGEPIQLRGWSTYGYSDDYGWAFDDVDDFKKMKSYGANFARIAQYITETNWTKGVQIDWVKNCIDYTNEANMYCLVDWHILKPGNPNSGEYSGYDNFFREITSYVKQKGYKHVLYEICNEPNDDVEGAPAAFDYVWDWVKNYAGKVLPIIGQNDPDAIVIVGTPQWDQDVTRAFQDPLEIKNSFKDLQIMYSFHYYAGDQQRYLGILSAAAAFVPVFISEWGLSSHTGNSGADTKSGSHMLTVANGKNLGGQLISWANWSWCQHWETSATFSNYNNNQLSASGNFITGELKKGDNFAYCESTPYKEQVFNGVEDFYLDLAAYDKGGQDNAYFDYDEDWACKGNDINNSQPCNAGDSKLDGFRPNDYFDVGYTTAKGESYDPAKHYMSLGYIGNGEWVRYTIDVKIPGDYEFEAYACNHIDFNTFAISVDGKPGLVDANGNDTRFQALYLPPCKGGKDQDYNTWGWVTPYNEYDESIKYRIHFSEAGKHVVGIAFMTSFGGLGSLKIKGKPENVTHLDLIGNDKVSLWPNPSENGSFNLTVGMDSEVKVRNAQGACVYTDNVKANEMKNFSLNLAAGVYFVSVENAAGVDTKKFVVK